MVKTSQPRSSHPHPHTHHHTHDKSPPPPPRLKHHILRPCLKNSNHSHFRPVKHLSMDYLPGNARTDEILKTVRHLARWVVRVRVTKTSPGHAGKPRRRGAARTCTGLATSIGRDYVTVSVPSHAVRDDIEALHTTAEFFYDDSDDDSDVIFVRGLSLKRHDLDHTAQLTCRACPELGHRILSQERTTVDTLTLAESIKLNCVKEVGGGTVVLISHPHGFSKKVTFGRFCGVDIFNADEDDGKALSSISVTAESASDVLDQVNDSAEPSSLQASVLSSSSSLSSSCFPSSSSSSSETKTVSSPTSSSSPKPRQKDVSRMAFSADEQKPADERATTVDVSRNRLLSLCSSITRGIVGLGRLVFGVPSRNDRLCVRVRHDAVTCPGSSGGAMILIGRRAWAGAGLRGIATSVPMMPQSLPVFLHVGTLGERERKVGVGVPVTLNCSPSLCLFCG